jgi:hypothetical protein
MNWIACLIELIPMRYLREVHFRMSPESQHTALGHGLEIFFLPIQKSSHLFGSRRGSELQPVLLEITKALISLFICAISF